MTDTSTTPATPPSTPDPPSPLNVPTPTANSGTATAGLADSINTAVKAAPELAHSPGLAVSVANSGGDTAQRAQAVARGANQVALGQASAAVERSTPGGVAGVLDWFGHAVAGIPDAMRSFNKSIYNPAVAVTDLAKEAGHELAGVPADITNPGGAAKATLGQVGSVSNKPLQVVQHEYRYLSDVEATHGLLAAIAASVPLDIGAVAGGLASGPQGAVLGAEAATAASAQVMFKDSWDRTTPNTYVDPRTGQEVSMGRDVASMLGIHGTGVLHGVVQHVVDGLSQIVLDPIAEGGSLLGAARSAAGAPGKLGDLFGGLAPKTAEDVERIYSEYPSFQRWVGITATQNAGEVVANNRDIGVIAAALGAAKTPDEVLQVVKEGFRAGELVTVNRVPTMSATRLPFNIAGNWVRNLQGDRLNIIPQIGAGDRTMSALGQTPDAIAESRGVLANTINRVTAQLHPQRAFNPLPRVGIMEDGEISKYVMGKVDPSDPNHLRAIYDWGLIAETPRTMQLVIDKLANSLDYGEQTSIMKNLVADVTTHLAGFNSEKEMQALVAPDVQRRIRSLLDDITGGGQPGTEGVYLTDGTHNISKIPMGDRQVSAAVLENQKGLMTLPDPRTMRIMAHALAGHKEYFGKLDDFVMKHVTQNFFKRWVLQSISYALHISTAEIIPNTQRVGFFPLVKAGMEASLGRLLAKSEEGDLNAVAGGVWRLIGGTRDRLPAKWDAALQEKMKFFAGLYYDHDGHMIPSTVATDQNISREAAPVDQMTDALRKAVGRSVPKTKGGNDFGLIDQSNEAFADGWQDSLRELSKSKMARIGAQALLDGKAQGLDLYERSGTAASKIAEHLDSLPAKELQGFSRNFMHSTVDPPPGMSFHDDWARVVVDGIHGNVMGQDGTIHDALLEHIAARKTVPAKLLDAIDEGSRPTNVKFRTQVPDPGNIMEKIATWGFHHAMNPVVNFLSRKPLYAEAAWRYYEELIPRIARGELTEEQARSLSYSRASTEVIKFVHNLNDRTQWTVALRNFSPFFFAQEQAYRRAGRLLAENPGAFRRYQMEIMGVHSFVAQTQQGGIQYNVIPGTGFLTSPAVGIMAHFFPGSVMGMNPAGMGWSVSSANVIFPFAEGVRPGVGPAYAIPIKLFSDFMQQHVFNSNPAIGEKIGQAAGDVIGPIPMNEELWKQFIPNTFVSRSLDITKGAISQQLGVGAINESRAMSSSIVMQMQSLATLQNEAMARWVQAGHQPTDPGHPTIVPLQTDGAGAWQTFVNRVRNQTRIVYAMRALLGFVTPVSPEVQVQNWGLPAELQADITKAGNYTTGTQEFLKKHPDATAMTVYQSHSTGGVSVPASVAAEKWVNDHWQTLTTSKYAAGALYLMPQSLDKTYSPTVYNEQIVQGLRQKYSATAVGTNANPDDPTSFLDQLYVMAGDHQYYDIDLPAYLKAKADPNQDQSALSANWSAYEKTFQAQNPVWASWKNSGDRAIRRTDAIKSLQAIFADGKAPSGPQTDAVKGLLNDWQTYVNAYNFGRSDGWATQSSTGLKANWQAYLTTLKADKPELGPIINGVFTEAQP